MTDYRDPYDCRRAQYERALEALSLRYFYGACTFTELVRATRLLNADYPEHAQPEPPDWANVQTEWSEADRQPFGSCPTTNQAF